MAKIKENTEILLGKGTIHKTGVDVFLEPINNRINKYSNSMLPIFHTVSGIAPDGGTNVIFENTGQLEVNKVYIITAEAFSTGSGVTSVVSSYLVKRYSATNEVTVSPININERAEIYRSATDNNRIGFRNNRTDSVNVRLTLVLAPGY